MFFRPLCFSLLYGIDRNCFAGLGVWSTPEANRLYTMIYMFLTVLYTTYSCSIWKDDGNRVVGHLGSLVWSANREKAAGVQTQMKLVWLKQHVSCLAAVPTPSIPSHASTLLISLALTEKVKSSLSQKAAGFSHKGVLQRLN